MNDYIKMLRFLRGHRKLFCLAALTMLLASFFEAFQLPLLIPMVDLVFNQKKIAIPNQLPGFLEKYVDKLNSIEPTMGFLYVLVLLFLGMLMIKNFLIFGFQYLMSDVSQRVMRDIRFQLYEKIQNLSLEYFSEKRTGELISRITYDANVIENGVSYALIDLFRQTFMIMFYLSLAFTIDPKASLIIFFVFPLVGIPMSKIGRHLKKFAKGIQEKMADINSLLLETISGIKVVKAFGTEDFEKDRFKGQNQEYYKLRMKAIKRLIVISPITETIGGVCGVFMIAWFGQKLMSGQLSFGVFVVFFGSIMSMISPIKKLGNANALIQQALAANDRIYTVLDAKIIVEEKTDAIELNEKKDRIRLENVEFHYTEESGVVLKDINLEVNKGELVAIVGPTGSGKTTLLNLIPRFYDPTKGKVTMDDINLRDVTFKSLRKQFGIVTQETILFNDTVSANIAYGYPQATQEEIMTAAKKSFAHRFIEKLPHGYDTMIGDRGFRLSGGEKQRISIARAILRNPPILLLDEATSQLDSESEKYVQEALDELMQGRTVVAIAHRLSTIKKANKIVVLEAGKIVGQGKHEELLKTCPLYERLHTMQFQL